MALLTLVQGYGDLQGSIAVKCINNFDRKVPIVLLDIISWHLRVFMHTLDISSESMSTLIEATPTRVEGIYIRLVCCRALLTTDLPKLGVCFSRPLLNECDRRF